MKTFFAVLAVICLIGCFAWVGGIETEQLDLRLGAVLLLVTVIAFGVFALTAQSIPDKKEAPRRTAIRAKRTGHKPNSIVSHSGRNVK